MAGVDGRRKVSTVKEDIILPPAPTKVPPTLNTARRQRRKAVVKPYLPDFKIRDERV